MKIAGPIIGIGAALLSGLAAADGFWPSRTGSAHDLLKADQAFRLVAAEREGGVLKVSWDIAPGYYLYRKRLGFKAVVEGGAQRQTLLGLNEVVVQAGPPFHMIDLDLSVDGEVVSCFGGDGKQLRERVFAEDLVDALRGPTDRRRGDQGV